MDPHLENILKRIGEIQQIPDDDKAFIENVIGETSKILEMDRFKLERAENDRRVMSVMLEESILDLEQKTKAVEAQNRELEIEASLERVRAQAMGMTKPDDLIKICEIQFRELQKLGFGDIRNTLITIFNDAEGFFQDYDFSDYSGGSITKIFYNSHPVIDNFLAQVKKSGDAFAEVVIDGSQLNNWKEFRRKNGQPEDERLENIPALYYYFYSIGSGAVGISNFSPVTEDFLGILKRFRNVFDLAYRRYEDISLAEAQAKEAQIEASLERVRAKAMSMHGSDDLSATVNVFLRELKSLGVTPMRCGVGEMHGTTRTWTAAITNATQQGDSCEILAELTQLNHPVLENIYRHWENQEEYFPALQGAEIKEYYETLKQQVEVTDFPEDAVHYGNYFFFREGFVFAWTRHKLSDEEMNIFRRFRSALSLTYRRYMELKEAEKRAFEAVKQASLNSIRADIASMRTVEDLLWITPLIWQELKNLGVPFIRCGVFIVQDERMMVRVYLSTPTGNPLAVLNLPENASDITHETVEHWHKKTVYTVHWNKEQFIRWMESMISRGQIQTREEYQGAEEPPDSLDLHFIPFAQGMLYIGNTAPLTPDEIELVKLLADAFSIAYARYEDFKNLEDAKNKMEVTLNELKETQTQLIHAEKMASLGELTAGIAHEIQNPLNFVNNFSEVTKELLEDLTIELGKGNGSHTDELSEDIRRNLDKILYHGKRADAIVKGMLQHSRTSSGTKEPTDLNVLAEEYLRLSYHGLRAKDKSFNAEFKADLDSTLPKIEVIQQEIGRVLLNLINNAFYAVTEKKNMLVEDKNYKPTVIISTRNTGGKAELRVDDNGNGIPAEVLDKIFQPFFTTKPAGQGTGLGLSLSYDIITKVHGGKLLVETKEGEGSVFIIQLSA